MAIVHVKTSSLIDNGKINADLEVEFGGIKKSYQQIPFVTVVNSGGFTVEGKFDLALTGHNIERPSLLGVSIEEAVPVTIKGEWNKL